MTYDEMMDAVMSSSVAEHLLLNPEDVRYQVGIALAILKWHIPPNIEHQQDSPLWAPFFEETFLLNELYVFVWDKRSPKQT